MGLGTAAAAVVVVTVVENEIEIEAAPGIDPVAAFALAIEMTLGPVPVAGPAPGIVLYGADWANSPVESKSQGKLACQVKIVDN